MRQTENQDWVNNEARNVWEYLASVKLPVAGISKVENKAEMLHFWTIANQFFQVSVNAAYGRAKQVKGICSLFHNCSKIPEIDSNKEEQPILPQF